MARRRRLILLPGLVLLLLWTVLLRPLFLGGPAGYIMVVGKSMEPTYYTGDLVITQRHDSYKVGDIAAFATSSGNVIHRIVGGNGETGFEMLGDNNKDLDMWKPKPREILGKAWLHIPGAGTVVNRLKQPVPMALTVGLLTLIVFLPMGRKARRRGKMKAAFTSGANSISTAMWVFVGAAVVFAALAGFGFRQPAETTQFVERARYEHTSSFTYAFQGQPSILYSDGLVGPIGPSGAEKVTPPAVYAKLTKTMEMDFSYSLRSALPPQVTGEVSVLQELKAGEGGWSRSELLTLPVPFTGSSATARVKVDLAGTLALIDAIEKETGASGGQYTLTLTPVVHVAGRLGADTIDESYSPAFAVKLSKTLIVPDSELAKSEQKKLGDNATIPADMALGPGKLPVATVRYGGLGAAVISMLVALCLAMVFYLGVERNPEARLKAKHGVALISVQEEDFLASAQRVEVAGMDDLGLLAQRDGQVVFARELEGASKLYFVTKDDVVYTYRTGKES